MTLGGHIFVRDNTRLDYCVIEAINSLLPICDEVVVMDCGSTDNTPELLRLNFSENSKVKLHFNGPWEQYPGHHGDRLRMIAEDCRKLLTTDWQFMLQADEVLHERSYPAIREAMQSGLSDRFRCRRVDLWGDVNRCIFLDISVYPPSKRPMENDLVRLARSNVPAIQDAGSLDHSGSSYRYFEDITIYHYSMVRDGLTLNRKICEMHEWYHSGPPNSDSLPKQWMDSGLGFDYTKWKLDTDLQPIPFPHPSHSEPWVSRHSAKEVDGWFSGHDMAAYLELVGCFKNSAIVEIGSWKGKSASSVAALARSNGCVMFCVDTWKGSVEHSGVNPEALFSEFLRNMKRLDFLGHPVVPMQMESISAAEHFFKIGLQPKLVFIDASHDYESVKSDIIAWSKCLHQDGVIAGHDYNDGWPGVIKAVDELVPQAHPCYRQSSIWWSHAKELKIP